MLRRTLALTMALALFWTAPGVGAYAAFAQENESPVSLMIRKGLIRGIEDPRARYLVRREEGKPEATAPGRLAARFLELADAQRKMDAEFAKTTREKVDRILDELTERIDPKTVERRAQAVAETEEWLKTAGLAQQDLYAIGSALVAVLARLVDVGAPDLSDRVAVEAEGQLTVAYDKKTAQLELKQDAEGRIHFSKQILERQKAYNRLIGDGKVDGAPRVPETGKLNHPTLMFPWHELNGRLKRFEDLALQGELRELLMITGGLAKYKPDQLKEEKFRNQLLAELRDQRVPGGYKAKDLLGPSFDQRRVALENAKKNADLYKAKVEGLKDAEKVTAEQLQEIEDLHKEAGRWLSLNWLQGQLHAMETYDRQMRNADFDKAVRGGPASKAKQDAYLAQKDMLLERTDQLRRLYGGLHEVYSQKEQELFERRANAYIAGGHDTTRAVEKARADIARDAQLAKGLLNEAQALGPALQIDLNAYSQTAGLLKMAHDTNSENEVAWGKGFLGTPISFKRTVDFWAGYANDKLGWFDGHASDVRAIARAEGTLQNAFDDIAAGRFKLAQAELTTLADKKEILSKLNIDSGEPISEMAMMQASIESFQGKMQRVQNVHFWADFGGNVVGSALLAGAVSKPLSRGFALLEKGFEKGAKGAQYVSAGLSRVPLHGAGLAPIVNYGVVKPIGFVLGASSKLSGNLAVGLESLGNVNHLPGAVRKTFSNIRSPMMAGFSVRAYNMFQREVIAALMLGGMSGGMEMARYASDKDASHYKGALDALWTGAKHGAAFSVKPENLPWLFGGGLPADMFGMKGRFGKAWFNFGTGGMVGGGIHTLTGVDVVGRGLMKLGKMGKLGTAASFTLGMADQMAKYYAGAALGGWAFEKAHYWASGRADDQKNGPIDITTADGRRRALDRAQESQKFGAKVMEHAWRFMPVHSLRMGSAEEYYASEHGMKEYEAHGRRVEVANATAGADLAYITPPQMPPFMRVFLRGVERRSPNVQKFRVSEDMVLKAIKGELAERAGGDPTKLLEITRMKDDAYFGGEKTGLRIRREVRAEAWEMYKKAMKEQPELANGILTAKGTPEMAYELTASKAPRATQALRDGTLTGKRAQVVSEALKLAAQQVKEETALAILQNANQAGLLGKLRRGRTERANLKEAREILEPYTKSEKAVNGAAEEYITALRDLEAPGWLSRKARGLFGKEPGATSEALKTLASEMRTETAEWSKGANAGTDKRPYTELVTGWKARIKTLKGKEALALEKLLNYLEKLQERFDTKKKVGGETKSLIQDAKGNEIPSLRPDQFDRVVEYLTKSLEKGRPEAGHLRDFVQLATGGGKTLLVFEALLPIVLADAKLGPRSGLVSRPKVVFITVNTNLQSQARTDFKAFRKILSDVEIMTAEQFKAKLAEGKMLGKTKPEDFWVIADEFDGLGLQPALTIGRETHVASAEHPAFRRAQTVADELEALGQSGLPRGEARDAVARLRADLRETLRDAPVESKPAMKKLEARFEALADAAISGRPTEGLANLFRSTAEKAIKKANPIYETFRTMADEDATRIVDSPLLDKAATYTRSRERLESIGQDAVSAAKAKDVMKLELLAAEAEKLLAKNAKGGYTELNVANKNGTAQTARIESMHEALLKLREVGSGRAKATPAEIEVLGRRYQENLKGGTSKLDVRTVLERDLTRRTRERSGPILRPLIEEIPVVGTLVRMLPRSSRVGLFEAFLREPMMDGITKTRFMAKVAWSRLTGRGWVRQEILNMAMGRREGNANVRIDNITGKVHPIHNGEFVPTMDTPTRRFYEVKSGKDLTLPYEHEVLTTVNDVLKAKSGLLGVSGTGPKNFVDHVGEHGVPTHGKATPANNVRPEVFESPTAKFNEIGRRYETGLIDAPKVGKVLEAQFKDAYQLKKLRGELASSTSAGETHRILSRYGVRNTQTLLKALKTPELGRKGLHDALKAYGEHGGRDLLVVGFSNTRELKFTLELLRRKGLKDDQISKIWSDTEYLAANYPKARTRDQMNLDALGTGKTKVLLVDMRVGGRGLDLPFKKGGYKNVEILIMDPHSIATVHSTQFQGRTAPNRLLKGAERAYYYLIDLKTAGRNRELKHIAGQRGLTEVDGAVARDLKALSSVQEKVEQNQMRSAQVLQDAPAQAEGELPIR